MLNFDTTLVQAHQDLLDGFNAASRIASDVDLLEDCSDEDLIKLLEISMVMLARVGEQTLASIELFLSGHWAAFEALSRISLEYSVRFSFLMKDDPKKTLGLYLGAHFSEMEKYQSQQKKVFDEEQNEDGLRQVESNRIQMNYRKELVVRYADLCGFSLNFEKNCKSALAHFEALGKTSIYRGLYSALSSQVHADAESLIDFIFVHCFERTEEERDIAAEEMYHWMKHYLGKITLAYAEACMDFSRCFKLATLNRELVKIQKNLIEIDDRYNCEFLEFKVKVSNA